MRSAALVSDLVYHIICESSAASWLGVVGDSMGRAMLDWRGWGGSSGIGDQFLGCRARDDLLDLGIDHGACRCAIGTVMQESLLKRMGLYAFRNAYVPSATKCVHIQLQFCIACRMFNNVCACHASDVAAGAIVWELTP